jgi:hypothetical protein
MDDLIEFLRARLDEDEQAALAASPSPWLVTHDPLGTHVENGDGVGRIVLRSGRDRRHDEGAEENAAHIARHDPARVLRDVEAKRTLVGLWSRAQSYDRRGLYSLRALAQPYSNHKDYRGEWRP